MKRKNQPGCGCCSDCWCNGDPGLASPTAPGLSISGSVGCGGGFQCIANTVTPWSLSTQATDADGCHWFLLIRTSPFDPCYKVGIYLYSGIDTGAHYATLKFLCYDGAGGTLGNTVVFQSADLGRPITCADIFAALGGGLTFTRVSGSSVGCSAANWDAQTIQVQ